MALRSRHNALISITILIAGIAAGNAAFGRKQGVWQALDDASLDSEFRDFGASADIPPVLHNWASCGPAKDSYDFVLKNSQYLPPKSAMKKVNLKGKEARALFTWIDHYQNPDTCSVDNVVETESYFPSGWGSTINGLMKPFMQSHTLGKALMFPHLKFFVNKTRCPAEDFTCFFQPLSQCEALQQQRPKLKFKTKLDNEMDDMLEGWSYAKNGVKIVPQQFQKQGWFAFAAYNLHYIMRPSHFLFHEIRKAKRQLGWFEAIAKGPIIGMHVRHGDSCLKKEAKRMARLCHPLSAYMKHARKMKKTYGATNIFLATDSEKVILDIKKFPKFKFMYMKGVKRTGVKNKQSNKIWDEVIADAAAGKIAPLDGMSEALLATLDIVLLGHTNLMIGKLTSNVFRTSFALGFARSQCLQPYVSLDGPWCFDYGMQSGIGEGGRKYWC